MPRERGPGVSVKPFKPLEREVTLECKISFTLYCKGTGVNCAVHKVFLLNEPVIIAVCWTQDLGMGHSPCSQWLISVSTALALPAQAAVPWSSLLGFKFLSCQTLENVFSSGKNV